MDDNQEICCQALIEVLRRRLGIDYEISRRPDRENSGSQDIDYVLTSGGDKSIAVEHTIVESFEGQVETGMIHAQYTGALAAQLSLPSNAYLKLGIPVLMYRELGRKERDELAPTITAWISSTIPLLKPFGRPVSFALHGGRFTLWLEMAGPHPRLNGRLLPALIAPSELESARKARIARSLSSKLPKLAPYEANGMLTYLLLEDWDMSLSNSQSIGKAVLRLKRGYNGFLPHGILQVTSYDGRIVEAWMLKEGDRWSSRVRSRGPFYDFQISVGVESEKSDAL